MADIDDLFTDPNAGAYEVEESRTGPPLTYVGEKLRYAVEHSHRLVRTLRCHGISPTGGDHGDAGPLEREPEQDAVGAFRYGLTAYLALYNMLGMILDHRKLDALLDLDEESLEGWLDTVQREGSVSD